MHEARSTQPSQRPATPRVPAQRVAIAGAIATVVSSILMLFSIGTDWGYRRRMHDRRNAARRSGGARTVPAAGFAHAHPLA